MKLQTKLGRVEISKSVFREISGQAAMACFGVRGMADLTAADRISRLLGKEQPSRGVRLSFDDEDRLHLELHIIVKHGVNIAALCKSIISEVSYHITRLTGVSVAEVNVFVDGVE